ncbi:MAG: phytanoyl-CoA dioxygenase family protein [Lentisphaeria bacterium]|nr:phytanoyl-CoA dioxygenase family protein [Lentisphaeria bacterium]NQZ71045.1 phytanoyl-CoA dioxygenase family protein [Lentisphaeria bacterium]
MSYHLTDEQKAKFHKNGYLLGTPAVYTREEIDSLRDELPQLTSLLTDGENTKDIREWHEQSQYLFDICMNPKILDMVESILGPNFFLWASNFFIKEAGSMEAVGWHQDAYYWPMAPHNSVTVWLAFTETNESNGAMKLVPGSHSAGLLKHGRKGDTDSVLALELEEGTFDEASAVQFCLEPGELSLHDDRAVHGSEGNPSPNPRIGFTIRYSATEVKNDYSINPHFKTYMCRGIDDYKHNKIGTEPTERFGRIDFKPVSNEEATEEN